MKSDTVDLNPREEYTRMVWVLSSLIILFHSRRLNSTDVRPI